MEVDILVSTALEKISPCNLTTEIGVPSGAKLRLFRDPVRAGQSRMVVCCDKPTASRLRHRFRAPRVYAHDGQLLSLTFVGMRPTAGRHPVSLPRRALNSTAVTATEQRGRGAARRGGGVGESSCPRVLPPPSRSPAAVVGGVESALERVEEAEDDDRRVPGIADLYEEFVSTGYHCNYGEDNSRDFNEEKECTTPSSAAESKHDQPRPTRSRSLRREEKWEDNKGQEKGGEEKKHNNGITKTGRQRELATSQKDRCRQRHVVVSVDDVTAALSRISSNFANAPKPVERIEVVSLLAKMYANGTAFVDNRIRCCEALDLLGIVPWHARTLPGFTAQVTAAATTATPSAAPGKGWLRVLGRVVGLVRAFLDFGAFVQVYVAAAERERLTLSAATAAINEEKTRDDDEQDEGERQPRMNHQRGDDDDDVRPQGRDPDSTRIEDRNGPDLCGDDVRDRSASPEAPGTDTLTIQHHPQAVKAELPIDGHTLPWLFPNGAEEGGKLAFNRRSLCGSAAHAKITLEAAAGIVRDAGKIFPSERAWRWCCENQALEGGRLLTFQDFVKMCEGLKEHMAAASIMSPEDECT